MYPHLHPLVLLPLSLFLHHHQWHCFFFKEKQNFLGRKSVHERTPHSAGHKEMMMTSNGQDDLREAGFRKQ